MVKANNFYSSIYNNEDECFTVYENLYRMLEFRGVDAGTKAYGTKNALIAAFMENDPLIITGIYKGTKQKIVAFMFKDTDGLNKAKLQKTILSKSSANDMVLIISPNAMKAAYDNSISEIEEVRRSKNPDATDIYFINYKILCTDIPKYVYCNGKISILNEEEVQEFIKINKLIDDCCIVVYDYDPLILWVGALPGDIILYEGPSETAGMCARYMYVKAKQRHVKV